MEIEKLQRSDAEWRQQLDEPTFCITRLGETERAFTGKYYRHKGEGTYSCVCCGLPLFSSLAKYDSGSGWPSFHSPAETSVVSELRDASHGMVRTEIRCARCDAHLGHVFPDGPPPTGLRYCVNSASLRFEPAAT